MKARSQAAYQGYSHLSGIEITSALTMCPQRRLRMNADSLCTLNAVLFEPPADVIEKELLGPEHPGQCLPHDLGFVGVKRGRN